MRRDLITRTIKGTAVTFTTINSASKEMTTHEQQFSKTFKDEAKLTRAIAKDLPAGEIFISLDKVEQIDKLYGLPLTAFMAHAMELDPVTREEVKKD